REGFPGIIELSYDVVDGAAILKCAVNATAANLAASPIQLLNLQKGQAAQTVTITNTGQLSSGVLTVSLVNLSGGTFAITDNCTGLVLAGGATCSIGVGVTSAGPQGANATLEISATPGGPVDVPLHGSDLL